MGVTNKNRFSGYVFAIALLVVNLWVPAQAVPEIQQWTTPNGARIMFIAAPSLPMVDVRVTFRAGSVRDGEHMGISRLTSKLLDEGAGDWSAIEIAERFDATGAQFSSGTLRDMAWLSLRTLSDQKEFSHALATFKAVLTQPQFGDNAISRIKESMLTSLKSIEESPSALGERGFYQALYSGHPYASPPSGNKEFLKSATAAQIKAFYARYYVARNAIISIVGDLDRKAAQVLAEDLVASLPQGERAADLPSVTALEAAARMRTEFPSTQTHIYIGQPGVSRLDPDYFVLYTGNYILGGSGLVSRLSEEVREKRGLSYSVYSYFIPMEQSGPFQMKLQTRNDQVDEALQVMRDTLQRFIDDGPTDKELGAAIRGITGGFPLRIDNNSKLLQYLAVIAFYDLPMDYLDTFPSRIEAVTGEQIRETFKRRLNPKRMATIIVGGQG